MRGLVQNEGPLYVHARVLLRFGSRATKPFPIKHDSRCSGSIGSENQKSKSFNTFRATSQFLDFLVFLGFFLFFGFRLNETMVFFGFPAEIQQKQGFFGFSPETQQKNKKNLVFFWFSNRNPKKHKVSLGRNPKNQKNPRKTKKSKSFGPFTKALDFWILGLLVSAES